MYHATKDNGYTEQCWQLKTLLYCLNCCHLTIFSQYFYARIKWQTCIGTVDSQFILYLKYVSQCTVTAYQDFLSYKKIYKAQQFGTACYTHTLKDTKKPHKNDVQSFAYKAKKLCTVLQNLNLWRELNLLIQQLGPQLTKHEWPGNNSGHILISKSCLWNMMCGNMVRLSPTVEVVLDS